MKDRFTITDVIRAGGCPSGIRRWFSCRGDDLPDGVNFRSFMRDGVAIEDAISLNDAFVNRALIIKGERDGE